MNLKFIKSHLPYLLLLIVISLLSVRGYLIGMTSTLPTSGSDDWIITWILNQTISKIPNDLGNIFNGNIFYPYENTIAFSIMMIPSAIVAYLPTVLTGSFYTAFNFTVVFSQVTSAIITYLIFFEISGNKRAASIATLSFVLSKIRMSFGVHIHPFVLQYFLLGVYFFIKYKKNRDLKYLYLTFFLMGIQVWESLLQVVFLIIVILTLSLFDLKRILKNIKHIILGSLLSLLIALPPVLSYIKVATDFGRPRSIREVAHFAASLDQYFTFNWSTGLYMLFFISIFLIVFAKIKKNNYLKPFLLILLIGFLFSLGPVLKWDQQTIKFGSLFIPLPYGFVYYVFPPLWAIRSVSRYVLLMAFGMAGVINITLPAFNQRFLRVFYFPIISITLLGGVFISRNRQVQAPEEYRKVYTFIKNSEVKAIAEYPFFGVNNNHGEEMKRMVYSLYHNKSLFNGASGFIPPERVKEISDISISFPEDDFIKILRANDVEYFVIHKDFMNKLDLDELDDRYEETYVYEDDKSVVLNVMQAN